MWRSYSPAFSSFQGATQVPWSVTPSRSTASHGWLSLRHVSLTLLLLSYGFSDRHTSLSHKDPILTPNFGPPRIILNNLPALISLYLLSEKEISSQIPAIRTQLQAVILPATDTFPTSHCQKAIRSLGQVRRSSFSFESAVENVGKAVGARNDHGLSQPRACHTGK